VTLFELAVAMLGAWMALILAAVCLANSPASNSNP
jgi:hypothetical protein